MKMKKSFSGEAGGFTTAKTLPHKAPSGLDLVAFLFISVLLQHQGYEEGPCLVQSFLMVVTSIFEAELPWSSSSVPSGSFPFPRCLDSLNLQTYWKKLAMAKKSSSWTRNSESTSKDLK